MATLYSNDFEAETLGTTPTGLTNYGDALFQVSATEPSSGSKCIRSTYPGAHTGVVFTGFTATADVVFSFDQVVNKDGGGAGATVGMLLRCTSNGATGIALLFLLQNGGSVSTFNKVSGSFTSINATAHGLTTVDGDIVHAKAQVAGTTISWKLWKNSDPEPGSWTASFSDGTISAAGYVGTTFYHTGDGLGSSPASSIDNVLVETAGPPPLTVGTATVNSTSNTGASITCTAPTGGTAPYTYQAYLSTSSGFTPGVGNIVSGQTSLSVTLSGLSLGTTYYFKQVQTDSTAGTVTTSQVSFTTTVAGDTLAANDSKWWRTLNWVTVGGGTHVETVNTGAYAKIRVGGTTFLAVVVDVSTLVTAGVEAARYPKIVLELDGVAQSPIQLTSSSSTVVLATGLTPATTYNVKIWFAGIYYAVYEKWTVPVLKLKLGNLIADTGATFSAPSVKPKHIICYGDSNGEGWEALASGIAVANMDATVAFPQLLGDALNAEVTNASFASQGYTVSNYTPDLEDAWSLNYAGASRLVAGAFSVTFDGIFVMHGQNDSANITTPVANMVANFRGAAPDAPIFMCLPPIGTHGSEISAGVTAAADAKAFYLNTGEVIQATPAYTNGGTHISAAGHVHYTDLLVAKLQEQYPAIFSSGASSLFSGGKSGPFFTTPFLF